MGCVLFRADVLFADGLTSRSCHNWRSWCCDAARTHFVVIHVRWSAPHFRMYRGAGTATHQETLLRTFTFLRALAGLVCRLKPRFPVFAFAFLASAIRRDGITALSAFPGREAGGLLLGRDVPGAFGLAVDVRERKSPIRSCERRSRFSASSRRSKASFIIASARVRAARSSPINCCSLSS